MVDCVKGVEEQTRKLMQVCRMRNTPVIIFINKMDREGQNPFDLLDELETELNISTRPLSWPIGIGSTFKGVFNIFNDTPHFLSNSLCQYILKFYLTIFTLFNILFFKL